MDPSLSNEQELLYLQWNWDTAYVISFSAGAWLAVRLDGRGAVTADTAAALREKIHDDYVARPVPRMGTSER